jgi:hypothetical protein
MNETYEDWTVAELQELLRSRELPVSGSKPELVERLIAADKAAAKAEAKAEAKPADKAEAKAEKARQAGECVVDDGTPHTGRAVNGVICSAHAMRYRADGRLRADG